MTPGVVLRSALFALFQLVITPAVRARRAAHLPASRRSRAIASSPPGRGSCVRGAERICGIRYRVLGAEHLPPPPFIVLSKHQSAWETLAFQVIFPPQVWVVKRELLWIPFFGWGLAMLSPIAIDRGVRPARAATDARAGARPPRARLLHRDLSGRHARRARRARQLPGRRRLARGARPRRRCCRSRTTPASCGGATRFVKRPGHDHGEHRRADRRRAS